MLSIIWDWKSLVHFVFLPQNHTTNINFCYNKLNRLKVVIEIKHPDLTNRKSAIISPQQCSYSCLFMDLAVITEILLCYSSTLLT